MFRRNKLVFTSLCIALCVFVMLHLWQTVTRSKLLTSSSVINNLRMVERRFAESLDLSSNRWKSFLPDSNILKNRHETAKTHGMKKPKKRRKKSAEMHKEINRMYDEARECMRSSQKHLALKLNHHYEREFGAEYRPYRAKKSPILEPECAADLDLIIILTTRPGSFIERMAIRYSWGRQETLLNKQLINRKSFKYKTLFTIGRDKNEMIESTVSTENSRYKDILRLDYPDTYENLAKKTVLTLKWISEACAPKFVLKTDDDCYVNLHNLAPWLQRLSPYVEYIGKKNEYMPVIRDPTHRNYVPHELFGEEFYKAYCSGGGYILRGSLLKNITQKANEIPEIINEDAYMGMITSSLNIVPLDDERFLPFIFADVNIRKRHMCEWTDKFLMHGVTPRRQLLMHWQKLAMVHYTVLCDL